MKISSLDFEMANHSDAFICAGGVAGRELSAIIKERGEEWVFV